MLIYEYETSGVVFPLHGKPRPIRELAEEAGLHAHEADLRPTGAFRFLFNNQPLFHVRTYRIHNWHGEPHESDEMIPKWHSLDRLPTHEMRESDSEWVPHVLNGTECFCDVYYTIDDTSDTAPETFDRLEWLKHEPPEN